MPLEAKAPRLPTLDGWRAIAILLVIWCHFGMGFSVKEEAFQGTWAHYGGFGVDVFFGISGLLITKLLLEERDRSGAISLKGFYVRRAFRILPPSFAYLAAVGLTVGFKSPWDFLSSAFFFRNYLPVDLGSRATGHLWSLAIEEHFYLIWPALLIWLGRRAAKNPDQARRSAFVTSRVAWISIAVALWRVAEANNHWTEALLGVPVHYRTDLRLDALLWGCIAAFVLHDSPEVLRKIKQPVFYVGMVVTVACVLFYSYLTGIWLAMLIPALLAATVTNPGWMFSRLLENPLLARIGKMSYSLYLWQELFLTPGWEPRGVLQTGPWNLLLTFACALTSYYLIEKPSMQFGRTLAARLRPSQPESIQLLVEAHHGER